MKKQVTRLDIKQAVLSDGRFRNLFPELDKEIKEILKNPGCGCNLTHFNQFFKYKDRLIQYFGNRPIKTPEEEKKEFSKNHWSVINCTVDELEGELRKLAKTGRKQLAIARWEDKITVVINDLGYF